tara:strand:+ start:673 stop:2223 length:1551 start_codon:yes stop_codon:yes gene_type:complete
MKTLTILITTLLLSFNAHAQESDDAETEITHEQCRSRNSVPFFIDYYTQEDYETDEYIRKQIDEKIKPPAFVSTGCYYKPVSAFWLQDASGNYEMQFRVMGKACGDELCPEDEPDDDLGDSDGGDDDQTTDPDPGDGEDPNDGSDGDPDGSEDGNSDEGEEEPTVLQYACSSLTLESYDDRLTNCYNRETNGTPVSVGTAINSGQEIDELQVIRITRPPNIPPAEVKYQYNKYYLSESCNLYFSGPGQDGEYNSAHFNKVAIDAYGTYNRFRSDGSQMGARYCEDFDTRLIENALNDVIDNYYQYYDSENEDDESDDICTIDGEPCETGGNVDTTDPDGDGDGEGDGDTDPTDPTDPGDGDGTGDGDGDGTDDGSGDDDDLSGNPNDPTDPDNNGGVDGEGDGEGDGEEPECFEMLGRSICTETENELDKDGIRGGISDGLGEGFEKLKETDLGKFLSSFKFPQVGSESCPQPHHPLLESLGIDAKPEIPCWIWSYIRTLILILACLAAYRIVFDD